MKYHNWWKILGSQVLLVKETTSFCQIVNLSHWSGLGRERWAVCWLTNSHERFWVHFVLFSWLPPKMFSEFGSLIGLSSPGEKSQQLHFKEILMKTCYPRIFFCVLVSLVFGLQVTTQLWAEIPPFKLSWSWPSRTNTPGRTGQESSESSVGMRGRERLHCRANHSPLKITPRWLPPQVLHQIFWCSSPAQFLNFSYCLEEASAVPNKRGGKFTHPSPWNKSLKKKEAFPSW